MTDAHLRAIHAGAVTLHAAAEAAGHGAMTAAAASLVAQVEAAIEGGDMPQPDAAAEAPTGCQHPQELRQSTGTLSGVYVRCRGCGARLS